MDGRTAVLLGQHPLWLNAVEQLLHRLGFTVVGKTNSTEQALTFVDEQRPDLLVTDIEMGPAGVDGLTCIRHAKERVRELKAVVLSACSDGQHIDAALDAGASAYVLKNAHPDDLASAIRQAFEHSMYLAAVPPATNAPFVPAAEHSVGLTSREVEILKLASQGHSNRELAKLLWVTEQTVKFHLSNIYRKLHVSNRTEAARWAQLHGVIPPELVEAGVSV